MVKGGAAMAAMGRIGKCKFEDSTATKLFNGTSRAERVIRRRRVSTHNLFRAAAADVIPRPMMMICLHGSS